MMKKNKYGMPPIKTRKEFEHNLHLVLEDLERAMNSGDESLIQNKMWATVPHLRKVKILPNHRVDISTINEMLRLQSNMMDWMKYRESNDD